MYIYHTSFVCFVWKKTTRKTLKVAASKPFFFSVYVIGTTCFDECFLFHAITGKYDFS